VKDRFSYSFSMNLRKKAQETLDDVSDASRRVVDSTEWATIALVAVAAVSVVALAVAVTALNEGRAHVVA
jgi:hypothetical protein